MPKRCADDTAEWYKRNYSQPKEPITVAGGSISTISLEYQNHYSLAKKGCFAVLTQLTSFKTSRPSESKGYIEVTHTLWHVNESAKLGAYVVKDVEELIACNVAGATCTSQEQWRELAKQYIGE